MLFVYNTLDYHLIGDFPFAQSNDFSVRARDLSKFLYNFRSEKINLPAGACWNDNSHDWIKKNGYYWTTKYDPSSRWVQTLFLNSTNLIITIQAIFTGFSIRPVR